MTDIVIGSIWRDKYNESKLFSVESVNYGFVCIKDLETKKLSRPICIIYFLFRYRETGLV